MEPSFEQLIRLAEAYTTLRNREEIIQTLKMSLEVKEGKITDLEARCHISFQFLFSPINALAGSRKYRLV